MMNLPKIPDKKTLGFVALGIVLLTSSAYLNTLQTEVANIGLYLGVFLILPGSFAQIVNWVKYWKKT
jgi:hypothetical protein